MRATDLAVMGDRVGVRRREKVDTAVEAMR